MVGIMREIFFMTQNNKCKILGHSLDKSKPKYTVSSFGSPRYKCTNCNDIFFTLNSGRIGKSVFSWEELSEVKPNQ